MPILMCRPCKMASQPRMVIMVNAIDVYVYAYVYTYTSRRSEQPARSVTTVRAEE